MQLATLSAVVPPPLGCSSWHFAKGPGLLFHKQQTAFGQHATVLWNRSTWTRGNFAHIGCKQLAIIWRRYDIPITIRNFFNLEAPGTRISDYRNDAEAAEGQFVKGFATIDNVALINVEVRTA